MKNIKSWFKKQTIIYDIHYCWDWNFRDWGIYSYYSTYYDGWIHNIEIGPFSISWCGQPHHNKEFKL